MAIPVQFVFQGGGARLVCLMAAAQAVHDFTPKYEFEIRRVIGTSAGAIAACMLASGKDPELFRQNLIESGNVALKKITRNRNVVAKTIFGVAGVPIYSSKEYRNFLGELFLKVASINHMKQLSIKTTVHAADINNGVAKIFDGGNDSDYLEEALFYSSALPFVFTSFWASPYVDGGLINNFPNTRLSPDDGQAVGFTFEKGRGYTKKRNVVSYAQAMLFTAMDVSVAKALNDMPPGSFYKIETLLATYDFITALEQLKDKAVYNGYVEQVKSFLRTIFEKSSASKETKAILKDEDYTNKVFKSIIDYHDHVVGRVSYKIKKKIVINRCHALGGNTSPDCDAITVREIVEPLSDMAAYGATIVEAKGIMETGPIEPKVYQRVNGIINCAAPKYHVSVIQIPKEEKWSSVLRPYNVMFFIDPPLRVGDNVSYEIIYSFNTRGILDGLVNETRRNDTYSARCVRDCEELQVIFVVPKDISARLYRLPEGEKERLRDKYFKGDLDWVDGSLMEEHDLQHVDSLPSEIALGWKITNLRVGQVSGVQIARQLRA